MAQSLKGLDISQLRITENREVDDAVPGLEPSISSSSTLANPSAPVLSATNMLVKEYLREHDELFRDLDDLRDKGWKSSESDEHFKKLQHSVDNADSKLEEKFYEMNKNLGIELHEKTDAFYVKKKYGAAVSSLNLCMAPGGYTWYFLEKNPNADACGLTLPPSEGGHPMYLPHGEKDPRVDVKFMDVTMLPCEFGTPLDQVPAQHPEAAKFSADRPFQDKEFNIVICDGQVLRVHDHQRSRTREVPRLLVSQLILGLQRIKNGGTFIILLHKFDTWDSLILLKTFESFSEIKLFKPARIHSVRSSYYLVAKKVRPDNDEAKEAIKNWKAQWWRTTFAGEAGTGLDLEEPREEEVHHVLESYGSRLRVLGNPLWEIQLGAMKKSRYLGGTLDQSSRSGKSGQTAGRGRGDRKGLLA